MAKTKTSFKKGQIANPNGRPKKGYSITEWFKEMLKADPGARDKLGKAIYAKAMEGDTAAMKLVWNYMDGPSQPVDSQMLSLTQNNIYLGLNDDKLTTAIEAKARQLGIASNDGRIGEAKEIVSS